LVTPHTTAKNYRKRENQHDNDNEDKQDNDQLHESKRPQLSIALILSSTPSISESAEVPLLDSSYRASQSCDNASLAPNSSNVTEGLEERLATLGE
jgi:hypothetical protein